MLPDSDGTRCPGNNTLDASRCRINITWRWIVKDRKQDKLVGTWACASSEAAKLTTTGATSIATGGADGDVLMEEVQTTGALEGLTEGWFLAARAYFIGGGFCGGFLWTVALS